VNIKYESKFAKDLRNIRDTKLLAKIKDLIVECKAAESLTELKNVKNFRAMIRFTVYA
jgi:hypothetical protein